MLHGGDGREVGRPFCLEILRLRDRQLQRVHCFELGRIFVFGLNDG